MTIRRCFKCNGLKYNGRGEVCSVCNGTGFFRVITREENPDRCTDRRVNQRRKADRRNNRRRVFDKKQLPDK